MTRFRRIGGILIAGSLACCAVLLPPGDAKAEPMTGRKLVDLIADADDPCRAQFEQAVEERDHPSRARDPADGTRNAERTCRDGAERLGRVSLTTPAADRDLASAMTDALAAGAAAMRLRSDLLAPFDADSRAGWDAGLREELGQADESCREAFERIAQP